MLLNTVEIYAATMKHLYLGSQWLVGYRTVGKLKSSYPHPVSMNGAAVPFSEGDVTDHDGSDYVSLSFRKTASFEMDICNFCRKMLSFAQHNNFTAQKKLPLVNMGNSWQEKKKSSVCA